jgi:putative ABC transport system permease protein
MALGAQPRDILKLVLSQGLKLALIGFGIGTVIAIAVTRFLSSLLYEISATDPATFFESSLLLFAVTLLASYLPARRATRIQPVEALRYE